MHEIVAHTNMPVIFPLSENDGLEAPDLECHGAN
jgi:hypothetical protein